MCRIFLLVLTISLVQIEFILGQDFIRAFDIPVFENEESIHNPWVGGLSFVQYSMIDLNGDSKEDLFLFDRAGNKVLTFLNSSDDQNDLRYIYAPEYETIFPEDLKNWVLLYDYNCDGLKDIFTSESSGIGVYKQVENAGSISFVSEASPLMSFYGFEDSYDAPLYNVNNDLPAITDIDNDGDTDILSFSPSSNSIYYYINNASDFGRCDTLIMELANRCYGFVSESQTTDAITLGAECDYNVENVRSSVVESDRSPVHLGGTLCSRDVTGDDLNELFIGDSTSDRVMMLTNSESSGSLDSLISLAPNFPANISTAPSIAFYQFPGVYFEDFNDDGLTDVASSSFHSFGAQDDESSWLYINQTSNESPEYELYSESWLQDEMIEHGSNSYPVVVDYNGDGLQDLVVGNKTTVLDNNTQYSALRLYQNIGTATVPVFELIDSDWLGLSESDFSNIYPTFGDIDNDSDLDLIIGDSTGKLHLYINQSGSSNSVEILETPEVLSDSSNSEIDMGQNTKPQLVDLNEDGLLDLIIGELSGNINYFENSGSLEEYQFALQTESLGNVTIEEVEFEFTSVPCFYKNQEGSWNLIVGSKNGHVQRYDDISNNLSGDFNRVDQDLFDSNDGSFSAPFVYDINGDGFEDVFIGNIRGGVSLYKGQFFDNISENKSAYKIIVFPNPVLDEMIIKSEGNDQLLTYHIVSKLGKSIMKGELKGSNSTIQLSELSSGVYVLLISTNTGESRHRFVKK